MTEHTKLPWKIDEELEGEVILGPDDCMVADCAIVDMSSRRPQEVNKANVKFIVKACNSHHILLGACERVLRACKNSVLPRDIIRADMENVIAKVTGNSK